MSTPATAILEERPAANRPMDGDERIGKLRSEVTLVINTHQAQLLTTGRRRSDAKPAIIGLSGFAKRVASIWHAALRDDPYADWWLIQVDQSILDGRTHLTEQQTLLQTALAQIPLTVDVVQAARPVQFCLQLDNPYVLQAATLLNEFDQYVCILETARRMGLVCRPEFHRAVGDAAHRLRGTFTIPQRYTCCEIAREDVHQGNQRAQTAAERMGPVPEDILEGRQIPAFVTTRSVVESSTRL